jgi:hypothetical protein
MQLLFRSLIIPHSLIPSKVDIPMERVAALVENLSKQLAEKADKSQLKQTAIQLLSELTDTDQFNNLPNNVSVIMPGGIETNFAPKVKEEPVEVRIPSLPKLEPIAPVMTTEINSTVTSSELQEKLALEPIKDLKAAIGINDKFQFIETLFGGDEKAFEQAIKTINGYKILAEAQFWIKSNLRTPYQWEDQSAVVKAFDLLVKRRFA